jgi:thiol-disulfide isomerase/thioredoxin
MSESIKILDCDHESVTVAWPAEAHAKAYELSLRVDGSDEWKVLSDKLQGTMTRKKNLSSSEKYIFRVRFVGADGAVGDKAVFSAAASPLAEAIKQPKPPVLVKSDAVSVTIGWDEVEGATGYQIQYRCVVGGSNLSVEDVQSNLTWVTIPSTITGCSVRKKNLLPGRKYHFKVLPVMGGPDSVFSVGAGGGWAASTSSEGFAVELLAENIRRFMPPKLLSPAGLLVDTCEQLAGKVIGVYFSAHWCGPCRQFTPQLVSVYQQAKQAGLDFEVVFVSADHSDGDFQSYFRQSMANSWCAVPYDAQQREDIQGLFKVSGIPRLVILSAATGRIVVDNVLQAGGISLDKVSQWVAAEKQAAKK